MTYIKPILHTLTLAATIGASVALYAAEQSTDKPPMTQHPATQQNAADRTEGTTDAGTAG